MNRINGLQVIVPHRGVNEGKSRLSAVLSDVARGRLNRWLLTRTLRVVGAWLGDVQRCTVISPCEVTLALARKAGVQALAEQPAAAGLNGALSQAALQLAAQGAQRLLILPCDLPLLEAVALDTLQALAADGHQTVIAPDRHQQGTNALLVDAGVREFAFGKDSLAQHIAQGEARGVRTLHCHHPALAFDLDTAADFAEWSQSGDMPQEFLATLPAAAVRRGMNVSSRTK